MTRSLEERLAESRGVLEEVEGWVTRDARKLPPDVAASLRRITSLRSDIDHWLQTLVARSACATYLKDLERRVNGDDMVSFGDTPVKYQYARFMGVQSYLGMTWVVADRICALSGRILCAQEMGANDGRPAKLVSHFVSKEAKKAVASSVLGSIRYAFGWPIALHYSIRNHFIHEGGVRNAVDFFAGPTAASAFVISQEGWKRVVEEVDQYEVNAANHRGGEGWLSSPHDDLRKTLADCEVQIDDALGVIVGSACHALRSHVAFAVGED